MGLLMVPAAVGAALPAAQLLGRVPGRPHAPAILGRGDDKHISFRSLPAHFKLFLGHRCLLFKVRDRLRR